MAGNAGRRQLRWRALFVACAFALAAAGCASDDASVSVGAPSETQVETGATSGQDTPTTSAANEPASASASPETRALLLALGDYETLGGTTFDTSLTAGRDVLLWFWAPW